MDKVYYFCYSWKTRRGQIRRVTSRYFSSYVECYRAMCSSVNARRASAERNSWYFYLLHYAVHYQLRDIITGEVSFGVEFEHNFD